MQLLLAWKADPDSLPVDRVTDNLQKLYASLFQFRPAVQSRAGADYGLVYLEQAPSGWKACQHEADASEWALSLDFPFNVRSVCTDAWRSESEQHMLLPAARALQRDPHGVLGRLSPHFGLCWGDQHGKELRIQIDGLGFCQLFEFRCGDRWAVSNRISAFKALGFDVKPSASDFAVKFALKGFPNEITGFENIRQFQPGQRCVLSGGVVHTEIIDVLGEWVHERGLSADECLELARRSLFDELKCVGELCTTPIWAGLTGGRDTRALVSTLLKGDGDFRLRVRGRSNSYDVRIARELARLAGQALRVEEDAVLPPATQESLEHKARQAVLWQAGHQLPQLVKMFLSGRDRLDAGFTNFMGQHGEIGRGMYELYLGLTPPSLPDHRNETLLFELFSGKMLPLLRPEHRERARTEFSVAYNERPDRYGLHGWRRLNFYALAQHTRRYNSGGHYAQPGQVVTPFLNVDFIRASYNMPVETLTTHPLHEYMVASNFPAWSAVEYDQTVMARDSQRRRTLLGRIEQAIRYYATHIVQGRNAWASPYLDGDYIPWRYWNEVGAATIEDHLQNDGLWSEVFEAGPVRSGWRSLPDELLLLRAIEEVFG